MSRPKIGEVRQSVQETLQNKLQPGLYYHGLSHTVEYVVPAVLKLGQLSGLSATDMLLLETAAWYHDLGWTELTAQTEAEYEKRKVHEKVSIRLARQALPAFGYSAEQIGSITETISATIFPFWPLTLMGQILVDADLSSIGMSDFFSTSIAFRDELAAFGEVHTEAQWFTRQLNFLRSFHYFSPAGRQLYDAGRLSNIAQLERHLSILAKTSL